jgi:hypothetical protein
MYQFHTSSKISSLTNSIACCPSSLGQRGILRERSTLFSAQHYNAIAKIFRENFPADRGTWVGVERTKELAAGAAIVDLALEFAKYFKKDNPSFDPLKFLDHCSPDVDTYPLSELWEDE